MIRICLKILKYLTIGRIDDTMVIAINRGVNPEKSFPFSRPEILETDVLNGAKRSIYQIVRFVMTDINPLIGPDYRRYLEIRTPSIIFGKGIQLGVIGIENLEPLTVERRNGPGSLLFHRSKERLMVAIIFTAVVTDDTRGDFDTVDPHIL
jgi:hypothetical protein